MNAYNFDHCFLQNISDFENEATGFFSSLAANNTNCTAEIPSPAEKVSLMNNFG